MPNALTLSRRRFLECSAIALSSTVLSKAAAPAKRLEIIGFIKPFQKLPFTQIADVSREIGWDGIECPVRKGGTIEPEKVEVELPRLMEALKAKGLTLPVIATDVENATDPLTEEVLRAASKLGIKQYRLKHLYYDLNKPLEPQLDTFRKQLSELAMLNNELKIQGTIQNHSGRNYVGAPVWDILELIRNISREQMAVYFDIGHAVVEGGSSWPIEVKLVEPHLAVVSVKDFTWVKTGKESQPYRSEWCPLGEGMVGASYFQLLKKSAFNGPISQHFEYPLGEGKQMVAALKKDLAVLRSWVT